MLDLQLTRKRARLGTARLWIAALGVVWSGLVDGCYNPTIAPDGLVCAPADVKRCPDGFQCNVSTNKCVRSGGPTGGTGGGVGSGGMSGSGGSGAGGSGGAPGTRTLLDTCTISNEGQANQSDDCASGLICKNDFCRSHCYQVCTDNSSCANSLCNRTAPSKNGPVMVCEVPDADCNPQTNTMCPIVGQGCFLLATHNTVCDCNVAGGSMAACSDSRQCFPGFLCPQAGDGPISSVGFCQRVCNPTATPTGCPGTTCHPFGAWGYCF